jgi:hypothetical protein
MTYKCPAMTAPKKKQSILLALPSGLAWNFVKTMGT